MGGAALTASPATRKALMSGALDTGSTAPAGMPMTSGKVAEIYYSGDGAFQGFRVQTVSGVMDVPAHAASSN